MSTDEKQARRDLEAQGAAAAERASAVDASVAAASFAAKADAKADAAGSPAEKHPRPGLGAWISVNTFRPDERNDFDNPGGVQPWMLRPGGTTAVLEEAQSIAGVAEATLYFNTVSGGDGTRHSSLAVSEAGPAHRHFLPEVWAFTRRPECTLRIAVKLGTETDGLGSLRATRKDRELPEPMGFDYQIEMLAAAGVTTFVLDALETKRVTAGEPRDLERVVALRDRLEEVRGGPFEMVMEATPLAHRLVADGGASVLPATQWLPTLCTLARWAAVRDAALRQGMTVRDVYGPSAGTLLWLAGGAGWTELDDEEREEVVFGVTERGATPILPLDWLKAKRAAKLAADADEADAKAGVTP